MLRYLFVSLTLLCGAIAPSLAQLRSLDNQADYIIVTSSRLQCQALSDFEQFRRSGGLTLKTVNVEDIYSEFPDSSHAASIRQFSTYAMSKWKLPSPKFMLLAGGVQFVPSNVLGVDSSYYQYGETVVSIDALYAVNTSQNDNLQDLALGRLPANTIGELTTMLTKTMRYEKESASHIGDRDVLCISDRNDGEFFDQAARDQMNKLSNLHCKHISFFAGSVDLGTRADMLAFIEQNPKVLMYIGHGNPTLWSADHIIEAETVDTLLHNTFPFVYLGQTSAQNFDDTTKPTIVHQFLSMNNGAVATIASSGITFAALSAVWNTRLMERLTKAPITSIGVCVQDVKNSIKVGGAVRDDSYNRYTVLGDPALTLHFDITASTPIDGTDGLRLDPCAPSVTSSTTRVQYQLPISGLVRLTLMDAIGNTQSVVADRFENAGLHTVTLDLSSHASGVYFCRLEFGSTLIVQKLVVAH